MDAPWEDFQQTNDAPWEDFADKAGSFLKETGKSLADPLNLMASAKEGSFDPTVNKLKSDYESIKPGLIGAANNFPLAPQAIASLSPGNYSQNLQDWNQKAADAKKESPISYGAGSVAGAVAPAFIPGAGEVLETAPFLGNAALGAASAVSNTDVLKNPTQAAKEAGTGFLVGGTGGKLLHNLIPSEETLNNFAGKKAIQSLELPDIGSLDPEERQSVSKFIQDHDLVGRDKEQILEKARTLSDNVGKKIGEIADSTEGQGLTLDNDSHMDAINKLLAKAQEYKGSANREAKTLARDYTAGASDLVNLSDNPSWSSIQNLKEQYGKLAFNSKGEVKSEGAKDTYFALKDMLKNIADKAQGNPSLGQEYKEALAGYSQMQPIESSLEKAVSSEFKGGSGMGVRGAIGLIKKLPGPVRAIAGPVAAALGHPYIGAMAALPELTNPAIQSKAASGLARVAKSLPENSTQGMTQAVNDYLINQFKKRE